MTSLSTDTTDAHDARLRVFMNLQAFSDMPQQANGLKAIRDAGYEGVRLRQPLDRTRQAEALALRLAVCGSGCVNTPCKSNGTPHQILQ
jgi:hypothetical protein